MTHGPNLVHHPFSYGLLAKNDFYILNSYILNCYLSIYTNSLLASKA